MAKTTKPDFFDDLKLLEKISAAYEGEETAKSEELSAIVDLSYKPPEALTVSEWADKYRRLSPESSAEAGPWRTSRTPYLKDIMDAFSDAKVRKITMVSASQCGKSELINNCIGYTIHQDPGSTLFVQPTLDDAKKFSRLRIAPMIRDTPVLAERLRTIAGKKQAKTMLSMGYPGGMLTLVGSQAASALASTPARYIFGDERDRWAISAGKEGDPWKLAEARQTTFYNAKSIEVSTPTIKGASNIEIGFLQGTQERWCTQCPKCGEWHEIDFNDIKFEYEKTKVRRKTVFRLTKNPWYRCPECKADISEAKMRKQPAKWIAENPTAMEKGHRSFWLNAFASPWTPWKKICIDFLEAKDDPERLKVVYNTLFGKLWEDRGSTMTEDELYERREDYGVREDGSTVDLPDGVLVLTCGVDTQDNRLEYEVVGFGHYDEQYGIEKGVIMGKPDSKEVWSRLDDLRNHIFKYKNGRGLRISFTCIDSGGHFTNEVYEYCKAHWMERVFPIKGRGGENIPFVAVPSQVPIRDNRRNIVYLYNIGVDAGKTRIMHNLEVKEPGPKFCHFPTNPNAGYNADYFSGLLSEKLVLTNRKWQWVKISEHIRNEPLDCRNYALAAFAILNPDLDAVERRRKEAQEAKEKPVAEQPAKKPARKPKRSKRKEMQSDW